MYVCTDVTFAWIGPGELRFGSVGYGGRGRSFDARIAAIAASSSASCEPSAEVAAIEEGSVASVSAGICASAALSGCQHSALR